MFLPGAISIIGVVLAGVPPKAASTKPPLLTPVKTETPSDSHSAPRQAPSIEPAAPRKPKKRADIQYGLTVSGQPSARRLPNGDIQYGTPVEGRELRQYPRLRAGVAYDSLSEESWTMAPILLGGLTNAGTTGGLTRGLNGAPSSSYFYPEWGNFYFPGSWAYYPYYSSAYVNGVTVLSPLSAYGGTLPGFIALTNVQFDVTPTPSIEPAYGPDGRCRGWQGILQRPQMPDYYLNRRAPANPQKETTSRLRTGEDSLDITAADIERAWNRGDIRPLAKHVNPQQPIAISLRGTFQYALTSGDYLDITRDAFRSLKTLRFVLDGYKRKADGTAVLTGRHLFRHRDGDARTVFLSFTLKSIAGKYVIIHIGTAPDKIDE